jgi:hypothetical protein
VDKQSIEESLAESIADGWFAIEKKAAAENSEENRKSEELLLEWAAKLATILKGPQK